MYEECMGQDRHGMANLNILYKYITISQMSRKNGYIGWI